MYSRGSRLQLALAVALSIGAIGCNKKPAPPPEAPPASPVAVTKPAARDDRPVIVAFGDSLTAGYGTDAGNSYPDYLERDLNAKGFHYHVVNAGISGNTTKDGIERLDEVTALKPAIVIVAFGGNDGLRGLPINSTRQNLDQIVSTLQGAGAKVVLGGITLPPNYGPDYIQSFNKVFSDLAAKHRVTFIPMIYKDLINVPGTIQQDGIHPTAIGSQIIARTILPELLPLLHK